MLDIAEADASDTDGASLSPLLRGEVEDGGGVALCEYEAHGTNRPARMVRREQYKLNYYLNEPPELYDLEADPGEFNNLGEDPGHAEIISELTEIILADWDPVAINKQVRRTQKERQLIANATNGKPWSPPWRNGLYG
jgi:choline-sulfatase